MKKRVLLKILTALSILFSLFISSPAFAADLDSCNSDGYVDTYPFTSRNWVINYEDIMFNIRYNVEDVNSSTKETIELYSIENQYYGTFDVSTLTTTICSYNAYEGSEITLHIEHSNLDISLRITDYSPSGIDTSSSYRSRIYQDQDYRRYWEHVEKESI